MHCRLTNEECKNPGMCAPFGGCRPAERTDMLERRIERLERIVEHICPDKSDPTGL